MVDIDQAMASLGSTAPAETSEPAPAAEPKAAQTQETAPVAEKQESGSASPETKVPETKAKEEQEIPKSEFAFIKLKNKIRQRDTQHEAIMKALAEASGVQYDPKSGDIESYVKNLFNKQNLEAKKAALEDDAEVNAAFDELRSLQAKEIWGHDEKAVAIYEKQLKPARAGLYKNIESLDPSGTVLSYLKSSKKAPLLEAAFLSNNGQAFFDKCLTDDPYVTKRNLEELENEMFKSVSAHKDKMLQTPAPVTTPSVNDGSATTQTKTGPSTADVASWF